MDQTRRSTRAQRRKGPFATSFPSASFLLRVRRTIAARFARRKQATQFKKRDHAALVSHPLRWLLTRTPAPSLAAVAMFRDRRDMNRSADKKTAFVTGASYGVGAATALALARDGFDVAVTATRAENLKALSTQLDGLGVRVVPLVLDLESQASIERAMADVVAAFGHLDLLVNN